MKIKIRITRRLSQDDSNDYSATKGRRHRSRLATRFRLDRFAIGALILLAALLATSLFMNTELYETVWKDEAEAQDLQATSKVATQPRSPLLRVQAAHEFRRTKMRITPQTPGAKKTALAAGAATNEPEREPPAPGSPREPARPTPPDNGWGGPPGKAIATDEVYTRTVAEPRAAQQAVQGGEPEPPSSAVAKLETAKNTPHAASSLHVARAQFTTHVVEREPVDRVETVFSMHNEPLRTLYYFTEIVGMSGETVTHQWIHQGTIMAAVSFDIGSDHWRVWSSKNLTRAMEGDWRVVVTDSEGRVLKEDRFVYGGP
ncbi:MAG TPA: DUF2914 domain-containing protein [Gammaproteobacteria bacterium]|nr:DUF2914 domain-containing protein [Gammaproteobacteria bacterium]